MLEIGPDIALCGVTRRKEALPMTARPVVKPAPRRAETRAGLNHAAKEFEEVAERIFRDESPAEPLFSSADDDLDIQAA